jgi:CheY-like chemotaxis protein
MTKILLVEDDKSLREIYGVRLLAEGYDIVSAGDGEEALAMAIKERPQLIVSDVMMPKISGFDMLDILRSTTETKDIRVIMMTALSSEDQRARGEALGADRYLVKSQVGIEDVVRTVHEVLGDAPVSTPSAAQTFAAPAPSAVPRTATPTVPPRQPAPTYVTPGEQPVAASPAPAPAAPAPAFAQPTPTYAQPAPVLQTPAPTPAPVDTPAPSGLPQPTAPFSTPRPANLGDRIIHPVAPSALPKPDLGSLMDQELSRELTPTPGTLPVAPPQPTIPAQPSELPATPYIETPPVGAPVELHGASAINFDEPAAPAPEQPQQPQSPFGPTPSAPRV